jgi:hypothetical protein
VDIVSNSLPQAQHVLSVVIRAHEGASLTLLDEALFSLAMTHRVLPDASVIRIERVLVTQVSQVFAAPEHPNIARMRELLDAHAQPNDPPAKVEILLNPDQLDMRSKALNVGQKASTGQYIAFLDYDDVVYPAAYTCLMWRLLRSSAALAAGGTVRAQVESTSQGLYATRKQPWLHFGTEQGDLLDNNFLPLHSFMVDRSRSPLPLDWFNESLSRLEDYDFLLRLAAVSTFDLSQLDVFVCEYRLVARHANATESSTADFAPTNVNPLSNRSDANLAAWAKAKRHIAAQKQRLAFAIKSQAEIARLAAPMVPSSARPAASLLGLTRATRIAIEQSGGFSAFLRRLIQLTRDLGVLGLFRRVRLMIRRV